MPKPPTRNPLAFVLPDQTGGQEMDNARLLPLDRIDVNPRQSRQAFDEAALEELAASIREYGVLEPILVRPQGDRYQILAGERRYRAAQKAARTDIPALIRDDLTDGDAALITALENLQREDLDIEDEARQYQYLMEILTDERGKPLTANGLAGRLGKNPMYIWRRLTLLQHPELLAAIRNGQITQRQALAQLQQPSSAEKVYHGDKLSGAESDSTPTEDPEKVIHGEYLLGSDPLYHGDTADPGPQLVERSDLAHGVPPAAPVGHPATTPRYRYISTAHTALRKIEPAAIPDHEVATWIRQVEDLEAELEALKRALRARQP